MGYDWTSTENERPSIDPGYHKVECVRVMTHKKDGQAHTSKDGSPQLYTVWKSSDESEALAVFTLSEKAAWKLRQCLQNVGANVKRMTDEGVKIEDFASKDFAERVLVGKSGWVLAKEKGGYINLDFVDEDSVPVNAIKSANDPLDEEYVPF